MSFGEIVVYLILAALCGLLGQMVAGRSLGGFVVTTIVGLIGAILGRLVAQAIGAPEPFLIHVGGKPIAVIWSIAGATLVTLLVAFMRRRSA
jgi:uncharacterized membrane protein YeaQ/YmgE (transglycosylase-associated protein family)